ncbi:hypothetical protein [uncultured Clostridium sp.]|uniref:hypothetical protein n=1 Tax=uncultured Clostridium sp. TaxID=59620 RepID=UPI0026059337|nr:hypothetical protein [uncultured Clostridium sp.]
MQILIYVIIIGLVFMISKNMLKPFGAQLRLKKDPDGLVIYNVLPISISYIIVILIIFAYVIYDVKHLNPITVALAIVFIIIALASGVVNSRMVIGFNRFSYMYSTMELKEMSKITIEKNPKKANNFLIIIRKTNGGEFKFTLPEEKKVIFKTYMQTHGKRPIEKA